MCQNGIFFERADGNALRVSREYLYWSKLARNLSNNIFLFINQKSVYKLLVTIRTLELTFSLLFITNNFKVIYFQFALHKTN